MHFTRIFILLVRFLEYLYLWIFEYLCYYYVKLCRSKQVTIPSGIYLRMQHGVRNKLHDKNSMNLQMRLDFMRLDLNCSWINKNISIFFISDA